MSAGGGAVPNAAVPAGTNASSREKIGFLLCMLSSLEPGFGFRVTTVSDRRPKATWDAAARGPRGRRLA